MEVFCVIVELKKVENKSEKRADFILGEWETYWK